MKWGVMIAETGRKLGAALGRSPVKANDIPAAVDELVAQRDSLFRVAGERERSNEELTAELVEVSRLHKQCETLAIGRENLSNDKQRTIDKLLRENDRLLRDLERCHDERSRAENRYRIPRVLRPLFVRRGK